MMKDKRQLIPIGALLAVFAMTMYMVVQLKAQTSAPDVRNAAVAEVHDGQGQTLLRGQFAPVEEDDDDMERKAQLEPTGVDPDAAGEAEVEFPKAAPTQQEIEFSVRNLEPGTALTFLIDSQIVGRGTVDRQGRAELETKAR